MRPGGSASGVAPYRLVRLATTSWDVRDRVVPPSIAALAAESDRDDSDSESRACVEATGAAVIADADRALSALLLSEELSPAFARALCFAEPRLARRRSELAAGLLAPKRARETRRGLLAMLYRAMTKASPFSSFTVTAVELAGEASQDLDLEHRTHRVLVSVALADALRAGGDRRGRLYLNPTVARDGDSLVALSRPDGRAQDCITRVARTSAIAGLLADIDAAGPASRTELVDRLGGTSPQGRTAVGRALDRLAEVGVLVSEPADADTADADSDPTEGILSDLEAVASRLSSPRTPASDVLVSIAAAATLAAKVDGGVDSIRERSVLFDDCVVDRPVRPGLVLSEGHCRGLTQLAAIAGRFDADAAYRDAVHAFLSTACSVRPIPLTTAYARFVESPRLGDPRALEALRTGRAEVVTAFEMAAAGGGDVDLDAALASRAAPSQPRVRGGWIPGAAGGDRRHRQLHRTRLRRALRPLRPVRDVHCRRAAPAVRGPAPC